MKLIIKTSLPTSYIKINNEKISIPNLGYIDIPITEETNFTLNPYGYGKCSIKLTANPEDTYIIAEKTKFWKMNGSLLPFLVYAYIIPESNSIIKLICVGILPLFFLLALFIQMYYPHKCYRVTKLK